MAEETRWFKNTEEMRDHLKAKQDGRTGVEFEVKQIVEPDKNQKSAAKKKPKAKEKEVINDE